MSMQAVIWLILVVVFHEKMVDGVSQRRNATLTIHTSDRLPRNRSEATRHKVRYKVRLQFLDSPLNQFLGDRSSARYKAMTRTLAKEIEQLFAKTDGVQRIYNLQFSSYKSPLDNFKKETATVLASSGLQPSSLVLPTLHQPEPSSSTIPRQQEDMGASTSSLSLTSGVAFSSFPSSTKTLHKTTVGMGPSTSTDSGIITTEVTSVLSTASPTDMASLSTTVKRYTSSHSTTATVTTTKSRDIIFNVPLITRLFKECYSKRTDSKDYQILLDSYLDAYTELLTIFTIIGPIFSFAGDDAKKKIAILRRLRHDDVEMNQNNYATFQNMFAYEYSPQGAKADLEGVSANKWIHRPLKLISGLIKSALDGKSEKSLGSQVQEIYSDILAPHHEWYVRAAVYLALLSFPSRSELIAKMGMTDSREDMQAFEDLTSAIDAIYDDVEGLYLKYSSGAFQ